MHLENQIQIKAEDKIRVFLFNKASTIISMKHFNYSNIFLAKNIIKLSKYTRINDHIIKLKKSK